MKKNLIKIIKYLLIFTGIIIFFVFVATLNINKVKLALSNVTILSIILVLLLTIAITLIKALRWKLLIKRITGLNISMSFSFFSILAGFAAGTFTPGRGGEIAKPLMIKSTYDVSLSKSISAVVIEKMLELSATVFLAVGSIILLGGTILKDNIMISVCGAIVLIFLFLIVKFPFLIEKVAKFFFSKIIVIKSIKEQILKLIGVFFESLNTLKKKKAAILFLSISLISDLLEVIKLYFIFNFLGIEISFIYVLFILEASILFALATMVPGGIGVTEIAQAQAFSLFNVADLQLSKMGILIDRILSYYLLVLCGAIILIFYGFFRKK